MKRYHDGYEYTVTEEGILQKGDWTGYRELSHNHIEMLEIVFGEPRKTVVYVPVIKRVISQYEQSKVLSGSFVRDLRRAVNG